MTTNPAAHRHRLHQVSWATVARAWRCAAAAVAIVTSVPAAAADALREECMRATSLRWTQLRARRHENLGDCL